MAIASLILVVERESWLGRVSQQLAGFGEAVLTSSG